MLYIFCNPYAGRYRDSHIESMEQQAKQVFGACKVISDVKELAQIHHSHIIITGGDGTVHIAVNTADLETNTFSIVALGSGNDFIKNFKRNKFAALLSNIKTQKATPVDLIQINEKKAAVLAGIGFDAHVSNAAHQQNWKIPAIKYIIPVIRHMFFYKGLKMKITGKDLEYTGRVFMLSCGNGFRAGGGFKLYPQAKIDDGKMDVLLIEPPTFWQKLKYVWLVNFGKHLNLNIVKYVQTDKISVELEQEDFYNTDGDVYRAKRMDIRILPGAMRVIM